MSTLNDLIDEALQEKTTKILPENIKKDVQIFDVVGTLEGEIKHFNTIEEMNSFENPEDGMLCIVCKDRCPLTPDDTFDKIYFPEVVKLSSRISNRTAFTILTEDNSTNLICDIQNGRCYIQGRYNNMDNCMIEYTTSDELTYNKSRFVYPGGEELPNPLCLSNSTSIQLQTEWDESVGEFMLIGDEIYYGSYKYENNKWNLITVDDPNAAKVYSSVEEMNEDTNVYDGLKAMLLSTVLATPKTTDVIRYCQLPTSIGLSDWLSLFPSEQEQGMSSFILVPNEENPHGSIRVEFHWHRSIPTTNDLVIRGDNTTWNGYVVYRLSDDSNNLIVTDGEEFAGNIQDLGKDYIINTQDIIGEEYNIIKNVFDFVFKVPVKQLDGLYEYNGGWKNMQTNLTASQPSDIVLNKVAYGVNGTITGTLQEI